LYLKILINAGKYKDFAMSYSPELLAPAGSLEKLKVAVLYGANAVYCGGQEFGLRTAAENFTNEELIEGVEFAHGHGSQVFVVLNGFLHDKDLVALPEFLFFLEKIKVDAVIVSDIGVVETVKKNTKLPIHLSTQASCLNIEAAKLWEEMGVRRVILGREASIADGALIKKHTNLEVELFIHGSMCMAYSGNCVISNYTQGRDSNRGGCAHSCRFEYELENESSKKKAYFMSSKDLNGLEHLDLFLESKIDSLKIEGRMKGHLYAATVAKSYSRAIKEWKKTGSISKETLNKSINELNKISHRLYTDTNLVEPSKEDSVFDEREQVDGDFVTVGFVEESIPGEFLVIDVKKAFHQGDSLELIPFIADEQVVKADQIFSLNLSEKVIKTNPGSLVKVPYSRAASRYSLIRRKVVNQSEVQ
jgi:U32 family peptidase